MTEENEKFMVISTKVSPFVYERIHRIAKKKGMKAYKLNQMVLDTLVRYMDDRHNLSEEMEHAMSIFEHMIGWRDALNLADPATEKEIGEAVYVLCDPEGKKKGTRAVMVHKPYFGDWQETQNVVDIFERMVEVLLPDQYRKLRKLAVDMDCNNLVELYTLMIDSYTIAQMDSEAIRKELVAWMRSIPWDDEQRARINPTLHAYHVGHSTITQRDCAHEFTVFWQIDEKGQPRTAHYMKYNADGHRVKKEQDRYHTDWFHAMLARDERWRKYYDEDKQQARQCLFGMHLLDEYGPSAAVHIVESEKTALLMAIAYGNTPLQVWMATCGEGNLTREKLMPIIRQGRHIILYPDRDGINKWKQLASMLRYDNVVVDTKPVTEWWKEGDGEKADIADVVVRIITENAKRTTKHDRVAELMKRKPAMKELIERLDLKRI